MYRMFLSFENVIQCILSIFSHLSLLLPGSPHKVFLNSNMALGFTGSFSDKYRMCSEHIPHSPYSLSYPPPSLSLIHVGPYVVSLPFSGPINIHDFMLCLFACVYAHSHICEHMRICIGRSKEKLEHFVPQGLYTLVL